MISRNGKRSNGKIQRSYIEDFNRKRKKREERLKSIVKLHTLERVSRKKCHRDWFPASSELLEIGEVVKVIRMYSIKAISKPLAHKLLNLSRD